MQKPNFTLKETLNVREWQKIQDNFAAVTEVGIRTVDNQGKNITVPSGSPRLCNHLKNSPLIRDRICGGCLPTFLGGKGIVDKNLKFSCETGLSNFLAPLYIQKSKVVGYVIAGPVILVMRRPKEYYQKIAEELSLGLEEVWGTVLEIRVISTQVAQSVVELIKDVCQSAVQSRYALLAREKEIPVADIISERLNKLLTVLLDVAFQISGADVGSVMSFNERKNELVIQSSRGIPREIIDKTRIKIGEGISGMAAEKRSSLLIDQATSDNRIKPYLNRPNLKSSMILPINLKDSLLGVMNLGATAKSNVSFNAASIKLMNDLINLTTLALQPASN